MSLLRAPRTYLVKLNDVWVSHDLEDVDFSSYALNVGLIFNLVLLQYFDGDLLTSYQVRTESHFSKGALSEWST